jgi:hypothetical protein
LLFLSQITTIQLNIPIKHLFINPQITNFPPGLTFPVKKFLASSVIGKKTVIIKESEKN